MRFTTLTIGALSSTVGRFSVSSSPRSECRTSNARTTSLTRVVDLYERSMARCQSRVKAAASPDQRAVWEELGQAAQAQVKVVQAAMG
jgi:hypothetical protein